jgi:uncharacterized protein (DUF2252 family)
VAVGLGACAADEEEARARWLRHTLVLDNQVFFDRTPQLAEGKLAKMGERLYDYFRGTAPQYARDLMVAGGPVDAPFGYETADTRDIALVGDPHPENLGTYLDARGRLVVDFNDFDAATYGPFSFDVRRLALGLWVAAEQIARDAGPDADPLRVDVRAAAVRECALGYAREVALVAADSTAGLEVAEGASNGAILDALIAGALADGFDQETLADYTVVEDGRRQMFYGEVTPARLVDVGDAEVLVFEDSVRRPGAREEAMVRAIVAAWPATVLDPGLVDPPAIAIKGIARRFGAGVSSYPQIRDYVLLEGPTDGVLDDVLIEVKQVFDPVALGGFPLSPDAPFFDNGQRVVFFQRALQTTDADDRYLGWATAGDDAYRIRERTGYQRGLDVRKVGEELVAGQFAPEDYVELARQAGRLLARAHGRAPTQSGARGGPAIAVAIAGDDDGFADEVAAFVDVYGPQVTGDHRRLQGLLAEHGASLGYVRP